MPKGLQGFQKGHKINLGKRTKGIYVKCHQCGKFFYTYKSIIQVGKGKFCSKKCYSESLIKRYKGKKHPQWKGGKTICNGYVLLHRPNHPFCKLGGYIKRSHLVMEKILGRYIVPPEVIHHKGIHFPIKSIENRQDDSPENLQLFANNGKHTQFHFRLRVT